MTARKIALFLPSDAGVATPTTDSQMKRRRWRSHLPSLLMTFFMGLVVALGAPIIAEARIARIEIIRVESPTFAGTSFGAVGQYEKLVGRAFGEVDPADPRNSGIVDLSLTPRNSRGMVEYSTDVYILRPIDRSKGNHRLFFEINNRGNNLSFSFFNDAASGGNDPTTAAHAGNGFLMRQGYTIVWSGWDATVAPGAGRFTMTVPVAKNRDGSPIVGPALEEFIFDNSTTLTGPLTYPATNSDKSQTSLTVRERYADLPMTVPATGWEYVNARTIRLLPAGTPFQQGRLYEFAYPAQNPIVAGLAFAGLRDLVAFLHHGQASGDSGANALAGDVQFVYSFSWSQPARFMHDFLYLGFNQDEQGRRVFDGIFNWAGGGSGGFFNYRFAQPGRTHRQHIGRWYPEREFPFANQSLFDPITGKTDGRLRCCLATDTCPKIFEVNSENEYWVKAGSLLHTDTLGNDLPDLPNVRNYLLSSLPHVALSGPGICQQPRNPIAPNPALRALLVALDQWAATGEQPPSSRVPRLADGTLVPSLSQSVVGYPNIPGVRYNGFATTGDLFDFGPSFNQGILGILPPTLLGSPYPAFVPATDADGNDIAGIRLPEIAVPLATYSGWGLRAAAFAGDDLCDAAGQKVDFRLTKAERLAAGDPRLSIEERYPNHRQYVREVAFAATCLGQHRLLLGEDVQRYASNAEGSSIGSVPGVEFDVCLQDDRTGASLSFNSATGGYFFASCSAGFTLTGRGRVQRVGCEVRLSDSRISATLDRCLIAPHNRGRAMIRRTPVGTAFLIEDSDTANNNCAGR
ncbi:MAG: alpha/beta hydrolase domain-containing protein [Acidobacteriota bacterium]|nr:alpha/beta hydrolase domain-containing protein [Acidobacteriota bacterium]